MPKTEEHYQDAIRAGLVAELILFSIMFGVAHSTTPYPDSGGSTDLSKPAAVLGSGAIFGVFNKSTTKPTVVPTFRGDPANSHLDSATVPTPRPTPRNEMGAPRVNQPKSK